MKQTGKRKPVMKMSEREGVSESESEWKKKNKKKKQDLICDMMFYNHVTCSD